MSSPRYVLHGPRRPKHQRTFDEAVAIELARLRRNPAALSWGGLQFEAELAVEARLRQGRL